MRKGFTISLAAVVLALLILGIWLSKLLWFRPFNIDHFFERAYIEFLWEDPEALSQTGVLGWLELTGYKHELTDVSPASTRRLAEVGRHNLKILERYDPNNLTTEQHVSYDVLHWFLTTGVDAEPFLFHDYPVTHISGAHIELPQFMASLPISTKNDIEDYLGRIERIDDKFGSVIDALEERRKRGVVPPTHILEKAIRFCDNFAKKPVNENILYSSLEKKLNAIGLLDPQSKQNHLAACAQTLQNDVIPAYKRLSQYLFQLERSSLAIAGVWQLPDGDSYYRNCLLQQTTLNVDPDSLYQLGRSEMARLKGEIQILQNLAGNNGGKTFGSDSAGRLRTIEFFDSVCSDMEGSLPAYFNRLPTVGMEVLEVPEYRAGNSTFAFYTPPFGEPLGTGRLYVNTWKANDLTPYLAKTYAYHEGVPGHHLQKGIQVELMDLPTFRRFLPFPAYSEGWAMYAERLGHEIKQTENPWDRIGMLRSDLFRTARMITDIGIHHKKWLREQAVDFMMENAGLSETEAADEVDRYIVWPGQGCVYKVGQMKFLELREMAESELGDDFDIREFHSELLDQGAMPLEILEKRVLEFVERKKATG